MSPAALSAWASVRLDDLAAYGFIALAVLVVAAFPKPFRRSLRRWFRDEPQSWASVKTTVDMGALSARLKRLRRPTLLLVPAIEPGFSKLGGDPELPEDVVWPATPTRPRTFLCQLDLAAVATQSSIEWLPREGRLYAFYDSDAHGLADVVCVLYCLTDPGPAAPLPKGAEQRFPERRVTFAPLTSVPSLDWLSLDPSTMMLDDDALRRLEAIGTAPPTDEVQHRIGGYPNEIQPDRMWLSCEHLARGLPDANGSDEISPAIERAAKTWRLLLQIDSEPALKMNFGDGGRLYVFVRERDARGGDFSKTVSLWQTY